MAVALTIVTDPDDPASSRNLAVAAGTTVLKAAHAGGVDITATCGGRGRCTPRRGKVVTRTPPPPPPAAEGQPGGHLLPEGYRPPRPRPLPEALTVPVAPPVGGPAV